MFTATRRDWMSLGYGRSIWTMKGEKQMFLENLKNEANYTLTENGAKTNVSTQSFCLDLFATIGALRGQPDQDIIDRFHRAFAEDREMAMKILFWARDIRGGLGERKVFRTILKELAESEPDTVKKNLWLVSEYGRWDDLLCLLDGKCEKYAMDILLDRLREDCKKYNFGDKNDISLLAKWLPSANTSSKESVRLARKIIKALGVSEATYRKMLTTLRKQIRIIENNLREKDYTFDYEAQPSKAMLKYRKAFIRNDGERYSAYLDSVAQGKSKMNTGTLYPYDIVHRCLATVTGWGYRHHMVDETERKSLDVTWNALEDFTNGSNSLVILDGSGSMYGGRSNGMEPIDVAMSLAIYFAEHTKGAFHNHFITFSARPRIVEIKGRDILEKVQFCERFNECSNTDLERTFELLLGTAVMHHTPQEEMPETLYIISDMEFDCCDNADFTNFQKAKWMFEERGYKLPNIVFWNVDSRNTQQPVTKNEQGVALVSGASPRIFQMVISGETDPMEYMKSVILTDRYAPVRA